MEPVRESRRDGRLWWDAIFAAIVLLIVFVVYGNADGKGVTACFLALAVLTLGWVAGGRKPVTSVPRQPHSGIGPRPGKGAPLFIREPFFWHGTAFAVLLVVAVFVLSYHLPGATFFLVFACPYAWAWPEGRGAIWIALTANVCLVTSAVLGIWGNSGWTAGSFLPAAASGGISLLFSIGMGLWISRIAVAAEDRGRLRAELESTNLELIEAHRQAGAAMERERFAHEIHDTLTQTLTAVVMLTERARGELESDNVARAADTLNTAERTARQALAETRSLIAEGRGTDLEGKSFASRIADLCERFGQETGITVHQDISGNLASLPRADQVVMLRCLQEILSNVRKHARARSVTVNLERLEQGDTCLTITDDGVGFPDSVDSATARGYGLAGIASRLALSTGAMTIATGSEGTRVMIVIHATHAGQATDEKETYE